MLTIYKLSCFLAESVCVKALDSLCVHCASCSQNASLRGTAEGHDMNRAIWIDWKADKHKEERTGKKGLLIKSRLVLFGSFSPWNPIIISPKFHISCQLSPIITCVGISSPVKTDLSE